MFSNKTQHDQAGAPDRRTLIRDIAALQVKLIVDGLRDFILVPVSLVAGLVSLFKSGDETGKEFYDLLQLGRRSERWINLFGHQRPLSTTHPVGSMDHILNQVESIVVEQYRKGGNASDAREAVRKAMKKKTQ